MTFAPGSPPCAYGNTRLDSEDGIDLTVQAISEKGGQRRLVSSPDNRAEGSNLFHLTVRDGKRLGLTLLVAAVSTGLWVVPNRLAFSQQTPNYKIIGPDLAAQGDGEISAIVVEDSDKGEVPLSPGDEVVCQGAVVPVQPGGKIRIPNFAKEVGNRFLVLQVTRLAAGGPAKRTASTVSQHIEVVPVGQAGQGVPTAVAHASEITTPGQPLRVTGQALDKLQKPVLVGQDGTQQQLGESVGSSLQRVYLGPANLPKGNYQFAAQDANGKLCQAPNTSINPTVTITGTQIRRRDQRGQFTVSSNTEGDVLLLGGAPQIRLDNNLVHVTPQSPGKIGFLAVVLGNYTLKSRFLSPEDVPPDPQAPRVDAKPGPVQARYDPATNQTSVSAPVNVVDANGRPLANTPVDVAVAHPGGVEYRRLNTDSHGRANFFQTLPGQVGVSALAAQCYRVLGRAWNKQAPPPEAPKPQQPQPPQPPVPQPPGAPEQAPGGQPPQPPQAPGAPGTKPEQPGVPPTGERPKPPPPPVTPTQPQPEEPHVTPTTTDGHTKECPVTWEILPGPGIELNVVTPKDKEEKPPFKTNEPVPLIVTGSAIDQLLQTCTCKIDGVKICQYQKLFDVEEFPVVDPVRYKWLQALGKGKLLNPTGPANLYQPPDLDVGQSDKATLIVEIDDSRGEESREATFSITTKREDVSSYKRSVKVEIQPRGGKTYTLPPQNCDCQPEAPQWKPEPALSAGTEPKVKVCAGERVILRANAKDEDTLVLKCKGKCGNATSTPTLPDETKYTWTAEKGKFPDYGGPAASNGWNTSVIYRAPEEPGEDTVKVTVKDSREQGRDEPVDLPEIKIEVYKVDLEIENVSPDNKESEGGYVPLNEGDEKLVKITFSKKPAEGKVTLDATAGKDKIKIWENKTKDKQVALPQTYEAAKAPKELWVEGVKVSNRMRDVELVLKSDDPPCQDKVKLTVLKAELDVDTNQDKRSVGGFIVLNPPGGSRTPRKKITVRKVTPRDFDGDVILQSASDKIKMFDASTGGTEMPIDGTKNKFANATLDFYAGKDLFVEGVKPSDSMRDVEMSVDLESHSSDSVVATRADFIKLTLLKARLDVDTNQDKRAVGGLVVLNADGSTTPRRKITVQKVTPEDFDGNVILQSASDKIKIFDASTGGTEISIDGTKNKFANATLARNLFVEGVAGSGAMRDVEISVDVDGLATRADFIKLTVYTVAHETVAAAPANRKRAKVGVGEEVTLTVSPGSADWAVAGDHGAKVVSASGLAATFTAGDRAGASTITGTALGSSFTVEFTVIEPTGAMMERAPGTGIYHRSGTPSVGFLGKPFIQPADVSFQNIKIREKHCAAVTTGYFGHQAGLDHDPDPGGPNDFKAVGSVVAGKGSEFLVVDTVQGADGGKGPPYSDGTFTWHIPWEYRVGAGAPKEFATVDQVKTIDSTGRLTISKGGTSVSKALDDPDSDY